MRDILHTLPHRDGLQVALPFFHRTLQDISGLGNHSAFSGDLTLELGVNV